MTDRARLAPFADFTPATVADWEALVARDLKGADFEKRLVSQTLEGLALRPLYTSAELPPGHNPARLRDGPWRVLQEHRTLATAREDLERGVDGARLVVGERGLPPGELAAACRELPGELQLVPGGALPDMLEALAGARLSRRATGGNLGADPLGAQAVGQLDAGAVAGLWPRLAETAGTAPSGWRTLRIEGAPYHDAGASEVEELGFALAAAVDTLRALEIAGLPPASGLGQLACTLSVGDELLVGIAKLRAYRRLWRRVAEELGLPEACPPLHGRTAWRMLAARDPHVNALRTTIAAFVAVAGGVESLTVLPYDLPLGEPSARARRLARNTQLVLRDESQLHRVSDPAAGSYAFEALSEQVAQGAWALFREVERQGGLSQALVSGFVAERIAATAAERDQQLAKRKLPLTGVSEFPLLEAQGYPLEGGPAHAPAASGNGLTLAPRRPSAGWEALRDRSDAHLAGTGARPTVFLASLGRLAEHNPRTTWISNLLQAGGIATHKASDDGPGGYPDAAAAVAAFQASGLEVAVICGSDERYVELVGEVAPALKQAGARYLGLAGRPGEHEQSWRAAGVDGFVYLGLDVLAVLTELHQLLGVTA